jgi:hypothetical protein
LFSHPQRTIEADKQRDLLEASKRGRDEVL